MMFGQEFYKMKERFSRQKKGISFKYTINEDKITPHPIDDFRRPIQMKQ